MIDPIDREAQILQWVPLAKRLCRAYKRTGILHDDLYQEAVVGLILAVDRFKTDRGSFKHFASRLILNQLQTMCAEQMRPFRIPMWLNKVAVRVHAGKLEGIPERHIMAVKFIDGNRIDDDSLHTQIRSRFIA